MTKQPSIPWDDFFMMQVYANAIRSKDENSHLGAVVVGPDNEIRTTGYNSFPRGMEDEGHPERQERPEKYHWFEHAERNAIYSAANIGVSLKGCRMYTNGVPCTDCARAVIQAGIKEVIVDKEWDANNNETWRESCKKALQMFQETGIVVRYWEGKLPSVVKYRRGKVLDG